MKVGRCWGLGQCLFANTDDAVFGESSSGQLLDSWSWAQDHEKENGQEKSISLLRSHNLLIGPILAVKRDQVGMASCSWDD
jgi:hypothetical protein